MDFPTIDGRLQHDAWLSLQSTRVDPGEASCAQNPIDVGDWAQSDETRLQEATSIHGCTMETHLPRLSADLRCPMLMSGRNMVDLRDYGHRNRIVYIIGKQVCSGRLLRLQHHKSLSQHLWSKVVASNNSVSRLEARCCPMSSAD